MRARSYCGQAFDPSLKPPPCMKTKTGRFLCDPRGTDRLRFRPSVSEIAKSSCGRVCCMRPCSISHIAGGWIQDGLVPGEYHLRGNKVLQESLTRVESHRTHHPRTSCRAPAARICLIVSHTSVRGTERLCRWSFRVSDPAEGVEAVPT